MGERQHDDRWLEMSATSVFGFIELSRGDSVAARTWLDRWSALTDELGVVDPGISRFYGDHIESLVAVGEIAGATARVDELDLTISASRPGVGNGDRGEVPGIARRGNWRHQLALEQIQRALELDDACPVPFERNRALLVAGVVHRRARHKAAARSALAEAASGFAALGARGVVGAVRTRDAAGRHARSECDVVDRYRAEDRRARRNRLDQSTSRRAIVSQRQDR